MLCHVLRVEAIEPSLTELRCLLWLSLSRVLWPGQNKNETHPALRCGVEMQLCNTPQSCQKPQEVNEAAWEKYTTSITAWVVLTKGNKCSACKLPDKQKSKLIWLQSVSLPTIRSIWEARQTLWAWNNAGLDTDILFVPVKTGTWLPALSAVVKRRRTLPFVH